MSARSEGVSAGGSEAPAAQPAAEPGEPADIIVQLRSALPSLAPAERRVGEIIVRDPVRAVGVTITDLAREARTSETTVVRFCRSVGVDSYPALRLAVARWAGRTGADRRPPLSPDIDPDDDLAAIVAKIGRSDAQAVADTAGELDLEALGRAIDAVAGARRVDIYGAAASGFVALDLQQKLHRVGLSAWTWSDPHMAITSAANLTPADVVIGISHTGTTTDVLDVLVQARARGARTIAITNFPQSPVTAQADIVLTTAANETTFRSGAMASRIAALTIVDCLFVGVAQRDYAATVEALARTRDALESRSRRARRGRSV
jgi:DNA-binding MurR/RpiR family transcriptional regulator